jgi:uncharacterized protein involved in type VI secretion and phage assembly
MPPVNTRNVSHCETQSAMVTDNHDPKGLGRVRVKFHWMNGAEKTPWIRVTSPHGGGGKGMFFIPEIGEEVIIGFEGDSPVKPYVIGTVYHGKASNSFGNGGNDVKALQTRSGNKVVMNDADGSVLVEDKDGNSMLMDGKGNITLTSNDTVTINAKNLIKLVTEKVTIGVTGTTNLIELFSKELNGDMTEKATIKGKDLMKIESETTTDVYSKNKVTVTGDDNVAVEGKKGLSLNSESGEVTIEGFVATKVVGGEVTLNCP